MILARLELLAVVLFVIFVICACFLLGECLYEKALQIQQEEMLRNATEPEEILEQKEKVRKNEKNVKL